jgi:RND family efflux transporter MFP subunit
MKVTPMRTRSVSLDANGRQNLRPRGVGEIGIVAIAAVLVLSGCAKQEPLVTAKMLVRTAAVELVDNDHRESGASYLAVVRAENETDLSFKVGGILECIGPAPGTDWDEGTPVKAGVALAQLKQADFTNALVSARAHEELTSKMLDRFRKLRAADAISQQELDVTEANWRTAQAQRDQAEQNLRESQLLAARDGVVLARYVNWRATVGAGQRVVRFADTTVMSVEVGLPDRVVSCLAPGQTVDVEVSALEGRPPFRGEVKEVGVAAMGDGRLFRVVIKVRNPEGLLRSGMTARIHVGETPAVRPGGVHVPVSALVTAPHRTAAENGTPGQLAVFVVQDGKAALRAIKTGDILNSSIIVTEGVQAGERVVTSGTSFLYDGAPVEVAQDSQALR